MNKSEQITGWSLSGSNPELYDFVVDGDVFHTGTKSGLLFAIGKQTLSSLPQLCKVSKQIIIKGNV